MNSLIYPGRDYAIGDRPSSMPRREVRIPTPTSFLNGPRPDILGYVEALRRRRVLQSIFASA